jgi:hypothetical protein
MSTALDVTIRTAGWHFMWLDHTCSWRGFGLTEASTVTKAITRALNQVKSGFDAAELGSTKVSKYPGFRIAKITASCPADPATAFPLSLIDEITIRQLAMR